MQNSKNSKLTAKSKAEPVVNDEYNDANTKLETAKADKSVWLMKCPVVVAKSWQSQVPSDSSTSTHNNPIAKVVLSFDPLCPDDPSSRQFTMEMAGAEPGNIPKTYALNMSTDIVPMCVFSETSQGKVAVEGKVENKFDMQPHRDNIEEYRKLCRERTNKSMVKNRQIQVIDNDRGVHMRPMPGMVGFISSGTKVWEFFSSSRKSLTACTIRCSCAERKEGKAIVLSCSTIKSLWSDTSQYLIHFTLRMIFASSNFETFLQDKKKTQPVKQSEMKRTRRDRGELEDIMFKLFERQPNWALKQLVQETDQPAQFLKEILNELCVYNKRGANQGTYELKPEYKKSVEDAGAE